ncbi:MAG: chemotaxis protein CheW [Ignavibacteriae bacterium]|nr:chemotaxis protein CheW [Ignavibacteriota bacterium]
MLSHSVITTFSIGSEEYAAAWDRVLAIVSLQHIQLADVRTFKVHCDSAPEALGATPLDFLELLGQPRRGIADSSQYLIVEQTNSRYALLVDRVSSMCSSDDLDFDRQDVLRFERRGEILLSTVRLGGRMLHLVDTAHFPNESDDYGARTLSGRSNATQTPSSETETVDEPLYDTTRDTPPIKTVAAGPPNMSQQPRAVTNTSHNNRWSESS